VIEDFLEPLGFKARDYLDQADGGWLFGYATALQRASWRPVIVWASRDVTRPERLTHPATGTAVWLVPGRSRVITRWNARTSVRRWLAAPVAALTEVLRRERCRAIITQEYEDPRFDQVVRIGRRWGIPVYASFQGGDRSGSWLEEMVRRRSIGASAGLIIPSASERARVIACYAASLPPITDIPNPIDLDAWQPIARADARQQLGIADDTFLVVNHGRIDIARKGLDVLVEAWATLSGRPGMQLVMIGSGQDDKSFARLLDERKPAALDWRRGYDTDRTRLRTWLSAADIYVSASRLEGMPVAPLEAMACGLPVVATDAKGLSDIIAGEEAHGGTLVPRDDPAALAAGIARLHADPGLRRRLSHAARKRVEDGYSLPAVSRALGALLDAPERRSA
jgi:starch synthase